MSKLAHAFYVWGMVLIVCMVTFFLSYLGYTYYSLPLEERFYHEYYDLLKPSGLFGQGLGVIGTLLIAFGVGIYIARKRYGFLERFIRLKYLLEFHIFLCVLGPILILFHTTFKFGGIVSIAFWSMVIVVLSGVVGRFIYIQIPRSIEGRALSAQELQQERNKLIELITQISGQKSDKITSLFDASFDDSKHVVLQWVRTSKLSGNEGKRVLKLLKQENALKKKIQQLERMKKLFQYWHVAHMPFALIMLIIVLIHIAVTVSLGYRWIF